MSNPRNNDNQFLIILLIYYVSLMLHALSREELIAISKCKEKRFIRYMKVRPV
jgi:hypothetical protein